MSWLNDYIYYTNQQESPEQFHIWNAIATIGAVMGRKCYLSRRSGGVTRYKIYPGQLMVVFVGGSGRVRKTTAVNPAKQFLRHIGKPIISGKSSPEAFIDQLDPQKKGTPNAVLIESEITVFLSKATYADPLIDILIKLADAEDVFEFNTRGGGKVIIPEPCLTVLGATTPESLGDRLPSGAHGSGFMSRVVFVYAKSTDRLDALTDVEDTDTCKCGRSDCDKCIGFPNQLAAIKDIETKLFDGIKKIDQLAGPFTFTKRAKEWFENFYKGWVDSPRGQGEGWPTRRPDHTLRVAMVISASKLIHTQQTDLLIDEKSLASAHHMLTTVEKDFDKAFAFVGTAFARDRQRIIEFISSKEGTATTPDLYGAMYPYFESIEVLERTLRLLLSGGVLIKTFSSSHPPQEFWSTATVAPVAIIQLDV